MLTVALACTVLLIKAHSGAHYLLALEAGFKQAIPLTLLKMAFKMGEIAHRLL